MPVSDPAQHEANVPRQWSAWYGLTLGNWLKLLACRPPLRLSRIPSLAGISLASVGNSAFSAIERLYYGRQIRRVTLEHPPIFILGHWRSGTTWLQNLLAGDPQFAFPTLYEVVFPSHFLVTERWGARLARPLLTSTRPMDNVPLGWDVPGEDEIALMLLTLNSPYMRIAFPNASPRGERLSRGPRNDDPERLARWKREFVRFCQKLTLRHKRPLVFKSPPHTARIPLLLEMFPGARFIHLIRNPYDVFVSTMHLQRVLYAGNSFTGQPPNDLEEIVFSDYLALYHAYHLFRPLIPRDQVHELRFEDLERDPVGEMQRLYAHLGFSGTADIAARIQPQAAGAESYQKNRFECDEELRSRIYERWRPAFKRYGYPA